MQVSRATITSAVFSWMCWNCSTPIASVEQRDEAEDELRLRARARHDLVRHVHGGARLGVDRVAQLRLPDDEAPLPGHEHVVEHDDRVDLLEARRERMVEVAAAEVEALATQEAQAGRVARDRERERVGRVLGRALEHRRGHDEDLVGERADRREDARAPDHDAVVVAVDDAGRERRAALLRDADRAVRLRVHERMREQQVVVAHVLVVALHVLAVAALVLAEPVGRGGERHERAVAVVARATEGAERELGRHAHRRRAPLDVCDARGLQERHTDALAGRGGVCHHLAQRRIVLEVEELRVRLHHVAQLRDA